MKLDYDNKIVVQDHMEAPTFKLTKHEALRLGQYGSVKVKTINVAGEPKACYHNSLSFCYFSSRYNIKEDCLGFACGSDDVYEPHAWVKCDGEYYEVTPQGNEGEVLRDYILCHIMKISDIKHAVEARNIKYVIAPMINDHGMIVLVNVQSISI